MLEVVSGGDVGDMLMLSWRGGSLKVNKEPVKVVNKLKPYLSFEILPLSRLHL